MHSISASDSDIKELDVSQSTPSKCESETSVQDTPVSSRPKQLIKQPCISDDMKRKNQAKKERKAKKLSDRCFVYLFWSIVLVEIWMNFWLLYQLGPILLACLLLKKLGKNWLNENIRFPLCTIVLLLLFTVEC